MLMLKENEEVRCVCWLMNKFKKFGFNEEERRIDIIEYRGKAIFRFHRRVHRQVSNAIKKYMAHHPEFVDLAGSLSSPGEVSFPIGMCTMINYFIGRAIAEFELRFARAMAFVKKRILRRIKWITAGCSTIRKLVVRIKYSIAEGILKIRIRLREEGKREKKKIFISSPIRNWHWQVLIEDLKKELGPVLKGT